MPRAGALNVQGQ